MTKIDVKAGDLTFGQRIELGYILQDPKTDEFDKMSAGLKALGYRSVNPIKRVKYWKEVLEGMLYWAKRERELQYNPTAEEKAAGIHELSKLIGDMGTVLALAKDFSVDPDEVLRWKYGKVYNILYVNLQNYLFEKRLASKQYKSPSKGHNAPVG